MIAGAAAALALNGAVATAGEVKVGSAASRHRPHRGAGGSHRQRPQPRREPRERAGRPARRRHLHGSCRATRSATRRPRSTRARSSSTSSRRWRYIGANCSGATNGMAQSVTIPAGVVMISDTATAPSISDLDDNDLVFRVAHLRRPTTGRSLAELAWEHGYRKLAVSYANDDYNSGLRRACSQPPSPRWAA